MSNRPATLNEFAELPEQLENALVDTTPLHVTLDERCNPSCVSGYIEDSRPPGRSS